MEQTEWSAGLVAHVAAEIKRQRTGRMTAQELSDACKALGYPIPRSTLAKIESGHRASLDLGEFLVIARALGVPPVSLIFPLDTMPTAHPTPAEEMPVWEAAAWLTGETLLNDPAPPDSPRGVLEAFRAHNVAVQTALQSTRLAAGRRRTAMTTLDPDARTRLTVAAEQFEHLSHQDCTELRSLREAMRVRKLWPAPLPTELAFVDSTESATEESP